MFTKAMSKNEIKVELSMPETVMTPEDEDESDISDQDDTIV
jgi:hypothetical protein